MTTDAAPRSSNAPSGKTSGVQDGNGEAKDKNNVAVSKDQVTAGIGGNDGGDDDSLDEEQLEEYREMIHRLGRHPDKVTINSLSMVAEDRAESRSGAKKLYSCIRDPLLSAKVASDRKLPLVYVVDSILKNVKGTFIPLIEEDAKIWMPVIHKRLGDEQRKKLKKVWNIWKDSLIFSEESWKKIGSCFLAEERQAAAVANNGIERTKDGKLLLPARLRREMQSVLDEIQNDVEDELDKVSLERISIINQGLFHQIRKTAEENLRLMVNKIDDAPSNDMPEFFVETRAKAAIQRSEAWDKLNLKHLQQTHDLITNLQRFVREGSSSKSRYTQQEAIDATSVLAAAAATAAILTTSLQRLQNQDDENEARAASFPGSDMQMLPPLQSATHVFNAIAPNKFTNEGVKEKNKAVVGILYEVGLPFVSSADGRRFATQLELSNHLDALFKKSQLEKSMARTEERGWYVADVVWTGELAKEEENPTQGVENTDTTMEATPEAETDPSSFTMPADETRDRCVICGINFQMFFDNDDGIYKYSNCRETQVANDDAAEQESGMMLVHVTCWRGLGSPDVLSMDQALQEALD